MVFEELRKEIQEVLKEKGFLEETLPQKLSIPLIKKGKNVLIVSPTGFGKTEAAMLGIFDKIMSEKPKPISTLYITPLKALNRDLFERLIKIASHLGITIDLRHGDTTKKERRAQLIDPADILVLTPETLQAILIGKRFRELLKNVKTVIIDEIHELANSKRGTQLILGLERLRELKGGNFQRIGLSATIGNLNKIAEFIGGCEIIDARAEKKYEILVEKPADLKENLKEMYKIINENTSTLIFVNTREMAEILGSRMKKEYPDLKIGVHHSSLSKEVRVKLESEFKEGKIKAIIATSSLELGIDIGRVDIVIQYGSPRQATKLIQRVGRAGHKAKEVSKGIILTYSIKDYAEALSIVEKIKEGWLEEPEIPEKPLDVLTHQIIGACIDGISDKKKIYEMFKKTDPYKNLKYSEFEDVIELLKSIYLISEKEDKIFKTRKGLLYYFENLSTIPSEKNYFVINKEENEKVGVLHQEFVARNIKDGAKFVMKGEPWKVIDFIGDEVQVIRDTQEGAIPSWEGELIPVPKEIAINSAENWKRIKFEQIEKQKKFILPDKEKILIESFENYVILHCCYGSKINETLSNVISAFISSKIGSSIHSKSDAYSIVFKLPDIFNKEIIIDAINEIKPSWIKELLKFSLKNSNLFEYKFFNVAKRFGIIRQNAEFSSGIIRRLVDIYEDTPVFEETLKEIFEKKLDVNGCAQLLKEIKNGKVKTISSISYEVSPFGIECLDYSIISYVRPSEKIDEIYEKVKERLLKKKFWFSCTRCGSVIGNFTVKNIPEDLKCSKCGARTIGFIRMQDAAIIKKLLKKKDLNYEEAEILDKFMKTGELFLNYGKKACFVMAGYGIGPQTAIRILSKFYQNEKELIKEIINAERNFLSTRKFWSDKS